MAGSINTVTLRTGFASIRIHDKHFRSDPLKDGQQLIPHLSCVEELRTESKVFIRCQCIPQMSIHNDRYYVEFEVESTTRKIIDGRCSCPAGLSYNCKHAASLYLFINAERTESVTDIQQRWKAPSKRLQELYPKGETMEKIFFNTQNYKTTVSKQDEVLDEDMEKLITVMKECGLHNSSLYKSLCKDNNDSEDDMEEDIPYLLETIPSEIKDIFEKNVRHEYPVFGAYNLEEKEQEFLNNNIQCLSYESALEMCVKSIGQSNNTFWFSLRKVRITASCAHQISRAKSEKTILNYFYGSGCDHANFRYGRAMEPKARLKYEEITNTKVIEVGLVIRPEVSWLGASPDGIVKHGEELITLEIKCPSSCCGKPIEVSYIENDTLKENHPYFAQIQLQMFCTNTSVTHLFVYSEVDYKLICINYNREFV